MWLPVRSTFQLGIILNNEWLFGMGDGIMDTIAMRIILICDLFPEY